MQNTQNNSCIYRIGRMFIVAGFLFTASSGNAIAYSSYHFGYGMHNYGYHGHYGIGAHYSSHGGIGTAGYVILGLFGAVLLSHILSDREDRYRGVYHRSTPYQPPAAYHRPAPLSRNVRPVYSYDAHEGWDALSGGNPGFALDIFAIQSQEDMGNGIPRVGFALAAAANGELDRGTRAMRKALSIDPDALNPIYVNEELRLTIDLLTEEYTAAMQSGDPYFDNSFMLATLSYLKQDYTTASNMIASADQSQSANNLRNALSSHP